MDVCRYWQVLSMHRTIAVLPATELALKAGPRQIRIPRAPTVLGVTLGQATAANDKDG